MSRLLISRISSLSHISHTNSPKLFPFSRLFLSSNTSYPPHTLLRLPALSPTMSEGSVSSWTASVGDEISPGSVLCEIETDKATVDFESQDEGFLAKIIVDGKEKKKIKVGTPIGVMVEEKKDVEAFKDFVAEAEQEEEKAASGGSGGGKDEEKKKVEMKDEGKKEEKKAKEDKVESKDKKQEDKVEAKPKAEKKESPKAKEQTKPKEKKEEKRKEIKTEPVPSDGYNGPLRDQLALEQQRYIALYGRTFIQPLKTYSQLKASESEQA